MERKSGDKVQQVQPRSGLQPAPGLSGGKDPGKTSRMHKERHSQLVKALLGNLKATNDADIVQLEEAKERKTKPITRGTGSR